MENMCIRVRFSPLIKNYSETNTRFCVEILPLVSCIENFDKIKWKQEKDKIEYIVPMNYKITIKKLKPDEDAIRIYYSCIDLLPSSLSNVELAGGDVYKVISDNFVLHNKIDKFMKYTKIPVLDIKLNETANYLKDITNKKIRYNESQQLISDEIGDSTLTRNVLVKKPESGIEDKAADQISLHHKKSADSNVEKSNGDYNDLLIHKSTSCTKKSYGKYKENEYRRHCVVAPLYKDVTEILSKEDSAFDRNLRTNTVFSSITCLFNELDILKCYNTNIRKNRRRQVSSNHCYDSIADESLISNIRIHPEVRVAKFVEKMEKEILPLKIILNNILIKFTSLGLDKRLIMSNPLRDTNIVLNANIGIKRGVRREINANRVVYSIIFDE